jgi:tetratricopeptide (TPR) repeat protein
VVSAVRSQPAAPARPQEELLEDVAACERLAAEGRFAEALGALGLSDAPSSTDSVVRLRALLVESWSRMRIGQHGEALRALDSARVLAEGSEFTDLTRADVLFRLGCCRAELAQLAPAIAHFTLALELCDRSSLPANPLIVRILEWRHRCYQRQGDWSAARDDVERTLALVERSNDRTTMTRALLEASSITSRSGDPLVARMYAEEAQSLLEVSGDRAGIARLLGDLATLELRLGEHKRAVAHLEESHDLAVALGDVTESGRALAALAKVHYAGGAFTAAEEAAGAAIVALAQTAADDADVRLLLGRALLAQERLDDAEAALEAADASARTAGARAAIWTARGDLCTARGDDRGAATFFRRAAEALQDVRF